MTAEECPLARAAAVVGSLRPDWRNAPAFYERRSEALGLLRRAAAAPCAACQAAELRQRARRLEALLRCAGGEVARYRRLLASASRPPRRRRAGPDPRQAALPLACHRLGDSGATPPSR
jgi:hypothetical protein